MPTAEELEAKAQKAKDAANKPLPAMVAPTVNLAPEVRKLIALRCKDTGESFSLVSNKLWIGLLVKENKITQAAADKIDLTPKRVGGGATKAKLEEKETEIAALKEELAKLKAQKNR